MSAYTDAVLAGVRQGRPLVGPQAVHIDITNACNAACVTCWDHSPLLAAPRSAAWKRQRLPLERFEAIVAQLAAMGTVRRVVVSGMGEPLVHPDALAMLRRIKAEGWHLTLMSNLVAADADALAAVGVDQILVGVQGVTPATYAAFHPGWTEREFFTLCRALRRLAKRSPQTRVRHVQVINRDTAPELLEMVRFGRLFGADRVNFKLAALSGGTEGCAITPDQRRWLEEEGVPQARALGEALSVPTNLSLFASQLRAAAVGGVEASVPIEEVGCYMGYVYARITVEEDVLFCCNTEVRVGSLREGTFEALWFGPAWQALRERLAAGAYFPGCQRCGKFEQNVAWAARARG